MTDRSSARAAKDHLRTALRPLPGVGGIGIGRRDGSYVVTVDVADEGDSAQVPASWDGVPVEVRVVGRVVPLPVPVPVPVPEETARPDSARPEAPAAAGRGAGRSAARRPEARAPSGPATLPWGPARGAEGTAP